ncbi:MAG TPA: hypothetical protein VE994_02175 [Terriglobales bacterium]|nr:hypothetical protein [Terriglobales bacterium]
MNRPRIVVQVAVCTIGLLMLAACTSGDKPERAMEAPITVAKASMPPRQEEVVKPLPPPTLGDVREALQRVFGDTLSTADVGEFLVGDFNGDQSEDVAVVVHPNAATLDELNSQVANWTIEDPGHAFLPPEGKSVVHLPPKPAPEQVRKGETLLAIIHGFGPQGWRNSQARQAYLLRNSAGMRTVVSDLPPQLMRRAGVMPGERKVISERVRGHNGIIFWTGATYAWQPCRSDKNATRMGFTH